MWPIVALVAAGLALASSGGKGAPHELLHAVPTYSGAPPPRNKAPPAKAIRLTDSDIVFAVEMARIHEPSKQVLQQFAAILQQNGMKAQAKELLGKSAPVKGRSGRVGDFWDTVFGGLTASPSSDAGIGDPSSQAGDPPPGWSFTPDGKWYTDPIPPYPSYDYVDAWTVYYQRQAATQTAQQNTVQGRVGVAPALPASSIGPLSDPSSFASQLPSNLPGVGQVKQAIATGTQLIAAISSQNAGGVISDVSQLAMQGASNVLANLGQKGREVAGILEGAAAGAAAGSVVGPYGAAIGAIIGALGAFTEEEFNGNPLPPMAVQVSQATLAISQAMYGWQETWGYTPDGRCQGWHMATWAAAAHPPNQMSDFDAKRLLRVGNEIVAWAGQWDSKQWAGRSGQGLFYDNREMTFGGSAPATILTLLQHPELIGSSQDPGVGTVNPQPGTLPGYAQFRKYQVPVAASVFWQWGGPPSAMSGNDVASGTAGNWNDTVQDLTYPELGNGKGSGPIMSAQQAFSAWSQMGKTVVGKTPAQVAREAVKRCPSGMWFACYLYGANLPTGGKLVGNTWSTVYWDPDTINAMATVLSMLSVGATTRAICSELMLQVSVLNVSGISGTMGEQNVSPGVTALLDDMLYMAHQEEWKGRAKPSGLAGWVAHYMALSSAIERKIMSTWIRSKTGIASLRTELVAANS